MTRYANKKNPRREFYVRTLYTLAGLVLLAAIAIPLGQRYAKYRAAKQEVARLEAEITDLSRQNSELEELINYLGSDEYIEKQARLNLNYRLPEEQVAVIKEPAGNGAGDPAGRDEEEASPEKPSNPESWWNHFFK